MVKRGGTYRCEVCGGGGVGDIRWMAKVIRVRKMGGCIKPDEYTSWSTKGC